MRFCICKRTKADAPVFNGLCYTPAELYEKSSNGIPIASQQVPDDHFIEGDTSSSNVVDIQYRRGIDINDLWNEEQRIRYKTLSATESARRLQKFNTAV